MHFPSKNAMTLHRRALNPRRGALEPTAMGDESEESDEGSEDEVLPAAAEEEGDKPAAAEDDEPAPVFRNVFEIMTHNPLIDDGFG